MKMRERVLLLSSVLLLLLGALAWWQGWFASEPVYHGRTVTQWLDAMAVYDEVRHRDETGESTFNTERKPEAIAADPALRTLLAMGPKAVPALKTHLVQVPRARPWWQRLGHRSVEAWRRFWDSSYPAYSPLPPRYASLDEARSMSAGLALLALGTNRGGGMPALIEEFAQTNSSTNRLNREFPAQWSINYALTGFPELRTEMRHAIEESLTHTNTLYRRFAVRNALVRHFPDDFPHWHPLLIRLAASDQEDPGVRDGAMFALVVRPHSDDPEFVALCAQILANKANSKHLRARATGGIRLGGAKDTNYMSVLRAATNDADSYVQQSARTALKDFERSPK